MVDFDNVIAKRVSVQSFTSKRPSWKNLMIAIDAALQGPFAGNKNNLKFIIVEHPEIMKKLSQHSEQHWIAEAKAAIVVYSDDRILEEMYGERGRVYSRQQAGAAIQTILFKLVDLGLSGCWVGAYTDEILKQLLKIPSHMQIEAIIPVGYAASKQKRKRKMSLSAAIDWEEHDQDRRPTLTEEKEITGHD